MRKQSGGFSLVELLVAMGIFAILMLLTAQAFKKILAQSSMLFKAAESNIEGVVGLEMLRKDVAQIGYGLPWSVQRAYSSAVGMPLALPLTTTQFNSLNDAPLGAPRAMASVNNAGYNGSDYLVLKSTLVAMNSTVKKSAILRQTGLSLTDPSLSFSPTETVTVINPTFSPSGLLNNKVLVGKDIYRNISAASSSFRPTTPNETYLVYGLDNSRMRAPFNRADYFIYRPNEDTAVPDVCAKLIDTTASVKSVKGIGILYKAVMNQANGGFTTYPILDCVADMQVVYGLDLSGDETVNFHDSVLSTDSATVRTQLKEVRIYILAQDGRKDLTYSYPKTKIYVGDFNSGREFDFNISNIKDWQNYRWKVYTIVVTTSI